MFITSADGFVHKLEMDSLEPELRELARQAREARREKEEAVANGDSARAVVLLAEQRDNLRAINAFDADWTPPGYFGHQRFP